MKEFDQVHFSQVLKRVEIKREELYVVVQQVFLGNSIEEDIVAKENVIYLELMDLLRVEESFLKQKSIIQWLKEKYLNFNFFHGVIWKKNKKLKQL